MEIEQKLRIRQMRKDCSHQGWALLIYYAIFYASYILAMFVEELIRGFLARINGVDLLQPYSEYAWGYFLAIFVGLILLFVWKKPKFCLETIWQKGRPLKIDDFFLLLVVFMGVQGLLYLSLVCAELILNAFGYTIMAAAAEVSGGTEDFAMFLYICVGAPIAEELLFRGLLLRSLQPMGKRFAIIVTAVLFGLFHGNIIQAPFACIVGLVLGYVTVEYSIGWAMVLHMFNNMIFADTLPRLVPGVLGNLLSLLLMLGCLVAGIVILILRRKDIGIYRRGNSNQRFCWRAVFSAPGMIVFTVVILALTILTIPVMITPLK